jgi:hypothetical protein
MPDRNPTSSVTKLTGAISMNLALTGEKMFMSVKNQRSLRKIQNPAASLI